MLHIKVRGSKGKPRGRGRGRGRGVQPFFPKPKYRSEFTEADFEEERIAHKYINDRGCVQMKKIELEDAQRVAEEEKEPWPPVWKPIEESAAFKSGLIRYLVKRHAVEDMDESEYNSHPARQYDGECYADDPAVLNKIKRFFKLVRDTKGYDVDWVPPPCYGSPFRPVRDVHERMNDSRFYKNFVNKMLECVVDKINSRAKDHGEEYKLLKVEKVVAALTFRMNLLTLSVELVSSSSDGDGRVEKHVQALVKSLGGDKVCLEWRFKPPTEDGPTEEGPSPKRKRKPLSRSQEFIRRYSRLSNPVVAEIAADLELPEEQRKTIRVSSSAMASLSSDDENYPRPSIIWSLG